MLLPPPLLSLLQKLTSTSSSSFASSLLVAVPLSGAVPLLTACRAACFPPLLPASCERLWLVTRSLPGAWSAAAAAEDGFSGAALEPPLLALLLEALALALDLPLELLLALPVSRMTERMSLRGACACIGEGGPVALRDADWIVVEIDGGEAPRSAAVWQPGPGSNAGTGWAGQCKPSTEGSSPAIPSLTCLSPIFNDAHRKSASTRRSQTLSSQSELARARQLRPRGATPLSSAATSLVVQADISLKLVLRGAPASIAMHRQLNLMWQKASASGGDGKQKQRRQGAPKRSIQRFTSHCMHVIPACAG